MRAATALLSLFSSGGTPVWRADERPADELSGPVLASGFGELDRELPGSGWPQGQLTELLRDDAGIGELSLLAPALAQLAQQKRSTVWVLPPDGTRGIEAQLLEFRSIGDSHRARVRTFIALGRAFPIFRDADDLRFGVAA